MRILIFAISLLVLFYSCNSSFSEKKPNKISDSLSAIKNADTIKDFNERFKALILAMQKEDKKSIEAFISPQFGLLIIESEGAMPFFHIESTNEVSFRNIFEKICSKTVYDGDLKNEDLPKIDCDKENFYTKEGSFVQDINKLLSSEIWKYGGLSQSDEKFAEKAILSVGKTVIVTEGYTYYFSYYKTNWYLTIIDTRRPCNA